MSVWTVAGEVGHSGTGQIEATYGHLGDYRHRARHVEYRVTRHRKALGDRVKALAVEG